GGRTDRPVGARYPEQLRRRRHPVGHGAVRRGELQPVLRRGRPGARGAQAGANRSLVDGFTVEEALVHTRLAADKVGATKLDRPEDVEPNPHTGKVYAAFTNNSNRGKTGFPGPDELNPRTANKFGHIVEIAEDGGDNAAETFTWTVPIVCGDPKDPSTYFMGFDKLHGLRQDQGLPDRLPRQHRLR